MNPFIKDLTRLVNNGNFSINITLHFAEFSIQGQMISHKSFRELTEVHLQSAITVGLKDNLSKLEVSPEEALKIEMSKAMDSFEHKNSSENFAYFQNAAIFAHGCKISVGAWKGDITSVASFSFHPAIEMMVY